MQHEIVEKNIGLMIVLIVAVISLGGLAEIVPLFFETKVTGLEVHEGRLSALVLSEGRLPCEAAVMAPGNSSRDLFEGLHAAGVPLSPKSFAVGVRMTHPQDIIDRIQYRGYAGHPALPAASYQLTEKVGDRGVYSFCMCPGGTVIPTPTEPRRLALNGMSNAARDSGEANSAVVVTVTPKDFGADDPLSGVGFQRKLEEAAYQAGGGGYQAPAQRLREFLEGSKPTDLPAVGYQPGVTPADLRSLLPGWITEPLVKGMSAFFSKGSRPAQRAHRHRPSGFWFRKPSSWAFGKPGFWRRCCRGWRNSAWKSSLSAETPLWSRRCRRFWRTVR